MQQVRDNDTYASQMLPYLERRFGKLEQSHSVLKDRFVDIHCLTVPFTKADYAQSGVPVPEDAIYHTSQHFLAVGNPRGCWGFTLPKILQDIGGTP